jgi:hypothetical protein
MLYLSVRSEISGIFPRDPDGEETKEELEWFLTGTLASPVGPVATILKETGHSSPLRLPQTIDGVRK